MYENLTVELERVEAELDGACPRCGAKNFEKRGSHTNPKIRCKSCGLRIDIYSKTNALIDLCFAIGLGGFMLFFVALIIATAPLLG